MSQATRDKSIQNQIFDDLFKWKLDENSCLIDVSVSQDVCNYLNQLNPSETNTSLSTFIEKDPTLKENPAVLEEIPTLIEIAQFIDRLFSFFVQQGKLSEAFLETASKLKPAMLKIAIYDHRLLTESSHVASTLLSQLMKLGSSLSKESPLLLEVQSIVTNFTEKQTQHNERQALLNFVGESNQHLGNFLSTIRKKAKIFEKRSREIAEGQSKASTAKKWVKTQLDELSHLPGLPPFLINFINESLQHVIFLEKLKSDASTKIESLQLVRDIAVCFQTVEDDESLDHLLSLQKSTIQALENLLERTSLSKSEGEGLIKGTMHSCNAIVGESKALIEENAEEEIIRLKPKSIFDAPSEEDSGDKNTIKISAMSLEEWSAHRLTEITQAQSSTEKETSEPSSSNQLDNNAPLKANLSNSIDEWKQEDWFDIHKNDQIIRAKLATKMSDSDIFIFVDFQGGKILECGQQELESMLENNAIQKIRNKPSFELALKSTLNKTVSEHLAKQEEEKLRAEKARVEELKRVEAEKQKQLKEDRLKAERQAAIEEAKLKVKSIAVGSWMEIDTGEKIKKCKLAARITSTQKYIFTDRSGIKILEPSLEELAGMVVDEKINLTIENNLFNQALASVISERRKPN